MLILFAVSNRNVFVPEQTIQFILIGANSDEADSICQASKSLNGLQQLQIKSTAESEGLYYPA